MPEGGKLIIETDVCELDRASQIRRGPVVAGRYVRLAISDSGARDGSGARYLTSLSPFFTTKALGKGTGLGMSIVYGIVKQSDGYVWVYSEPGHGTAFKIYLPLSSLAVDPADVSPIVESLRGSETILLVEDNQELRSLVAEFLTGRGYRIVESEGGKQAGPSGGAAKQTVPVQVLITDIMMPGMNGRELAERLMETIPDLRVLYISGFTPDGAVQMRILGHGEAFLQKPFALADLSTKLREIVNRCSRKARSCISEGHLVAETIYQRFRSLLPERLRISKRNLGDEIACLKNVVNMSPRVGARLRSRPRPLRNRRATGRTLRNFGIAIGCRGIAVERRPISCLRVDNLWIRSWVKGEVSRAI